MPKHPVSLWLIAERKRHGWKAEEVARRLREAGVDAADGTYRVWESGRKPKDDAIRAMETLFGSSAPKEAPTASTDVDRLVQTVLAQSGYIADLTGAIDQQRKDIAALLELVTRLLPGPAAAEPVSDTATPAAGDEPDVVSAALALGRLESDTEPASGLRVVPVEDTQRRPGR